MFCWKDVKPTKAEVLGFAKSRPTAQRPEVLISTVFCPAVNPRTCTDLHRVLVCNMDDGEFEFVYHLIIWIVWQCTSSLSGSVNRRINREWQRFSLNKKQRKKGLKRIQMIIKILTEFKRTVVNFARPNQMQTCACAWMYHWTKKLWKMTGLGARASRLSWAIGRWAVGLLLEKPQ